MFTRTHHQLPGSGCGLLGIIVSDDKIWLSIVGMLENIPWGDTVPLVLCVDTSVSFCCVI